MRLENFLKESEEDKFIEELRKIYRTLTSNCSTFIKEIGREVNLYRGIKNSFSGMIEVKPRTSRLPRNTPRKLHDLMDAAFKKKFGWKVRSEGVFVSSLESGAMVFGNPGLFFPKNGYKYVYTEWFSDLTVELSNAGFLEFTEIDIPGKLKSLPNQEYIEELVDKYTDRNLKNTILYEMGNLEASFKCSSYFLVPTSLDHKLNGFLYKNFSIPPRGTFFNVLETALSLIDGKK
jgi:hypothetical protein